MCGTAVRFRNNGIAEIPELGYEFIAMTNLLRKRWGLLVTLALILSAVAFLKFRTTLADRIAYNNGYDAGEMERTIDRKVLKFESFHHNIFTNPETRKMYNAGFEDALQGRARRYADPASEHAPTDSEADRLEQPDASSHSDADSTSPAGDYAINSMYGEALPKN